MTKEEAKEIFLNRGFVNGLFDGDKWRQSIVVVSKWLEQEPCDCISRQAVLACKQTFTDNAGYETEYVDIEDIKALPSIQPKPKTEWIPVSERMPEDGEECIITIRERWGEDEEWDYEITTAYYHNDKWIPSYDVWEGQELEITAWMLLPTEPYKPTEKE
jgi:hypothetical protein